LSQKKCQLGIRFASVNWRYQRVWLPASNEATAHSEQTKPTVWPPHNHTSCSPLHTGFCRILCK